MKKYKFLSTLIAFLFILFGCSKEGEIELERLDRTIFIEDSLAPSLPIYSELGYNTFGAYIDREPFRSSNTVIPNKIIVEDNILKFQLIGEIPHTNNPTLIEFSIKGLTPETYEDLNILDDKKIDLTDTDVSIKYSNWQNDNIKIIEGELYFKKARALFVDKKLSKMILSGTFGFKALQNKNPITIKKGRFDLGFGDDNFYNLK